MQDYQGNARKDKEDKPVKDKKIEKVVVDEVITRKKPLGRKFKDIIIEADFRSVTHYLFADVFIPAVKNTIVDATTKGIDRMIYGPQGSQRRGYSPRTTYNNPINRSYRDSSAARYAPSVSSMPRSSRLAREDFVLSSREEAELVLERMNDIIETYEVVSVADLNELVGFPTTHVDNEWGWTDLRTAHIGQIREGFVINFPSAERI